MMPYEVREILHSSYTTSRTGNAGHYQGGDACLELLNKEAKAWIKQSAVPSEKEWLRVFRNMDSMNKVLSLPLSVYFVYFQFQYI